MRLAKHNIVIGVSAVVLFAACDDSPTGSSLVTCPVTPDGQATILPLFERPFSGEFELGNFFDHDLPITFDMQSDNNNFLLTFCGGRVSGFDGHPGYDWNLPEGTPLLAVADGVVDLAGEAEPQFCPPLGRMTTGLIVLLRHAAPSGEEFVTLFAHMSRVDIEVGQQVVSGQQIGLSGNTGCSSGPHLHFETGRIVDGRNVQIDPYGWSGDGIDPWSVHPDGVDSVYLWRPGEAPSLEW